MSSASMQSTRFDWARGDRTGVPEAVYAERKTVDQLRAVIDAARQRSEPLLLTRLDADKAAGLAADAFDYDPISRTAILGPLPPRRFIGRALAIVGAGTSDLPVLLETQRAATFLGIESTIFADVGVAGLWRIAEILPELRQYAVIIAAAGMEGALFSVLAGLVPAPLIAVPTSVGYGVGAGGSTALAAALCGCAPGILTVNIDNGFGAAAAARKILAVNLERPS